MLHYQLSSHFELQQTIHPKEREEDSLENGNGNLIETILTYEAPKGRGKDCIAYHFGFTVVVCHKETCEYCQTTTTVQPGEKWRSLLEEQDNRWKGTVFYIGHRVERIIDQESNSPSNIDVVTAIDRRIENGLLAVGGYGEIGGNCSAYLANGEALVVDSGLRIKDGEMGEISFSALDDYRVAGLVLSHAHQDHIGSAGALLKDHPEALVYGTKLTLAMLNRQFAVKNQMVALDDNMFEFEEKIQLTDGLEFTAFPVDHSIPGAIGLVIEAAGKAWIHLTDFRFSPSQWEKRYEFFNWLDWIRNQYPSSTLVLDCLGACRDDGGIKEEDVWRELEQIILEAKGRVFVTTFSSQVERIQAVLDIIQGWQQSRGLRFGGFLGRTMNEISRLAEELGYLFLPVPKTKGRPVFLIAGSQGESDSALAMSLEGFLPGDTVVLSSSAIPENAERVRILCAGLEELGCLVVIDKNQPPEIPGKRRLVHRSGHEHLLGLIEVTNRVQPSRVVPCHGRPEQVAALSDALQGVGYPEKFVVSLRNGDFLV